ncbi:MAG: 30S ribosomal protein S9 [Planctomycetes bacterium]|nr:30S ribosomal protein S9 [Planctomycetota bacterium]
MTEAAAKEFIWGTGRRKTAVARVRITPGTGTLLVNGRPFETFFPIEQQRLMAQAPLVVTSTLGKYDVWARIDGGGPLGQSGAMRLGVARALKAADPALEEALRASGFLTRDSRMVERKKYGQRKARRRFQFSKR